MRGQLPDLARLVSSLQAQGPDAAARVADAVRAEAPVGAGEHAGRLRDSIEGESEATGQGVTLRAVTDVAYARYVLEGTRPHPIVPVTAQALHFEWHGGWVFFAHVAHPGTAPNPFGERAMTPIDGIIDGLVSAAIEAV